MSQRMLHSLILVSCAAVQAGGLAAAQPDFATVVESTKPVAYFRLTGTSGNGEVGGTSYKSNSGVSAASGAGPGGAAGFVQLDGKTGLIQTTQSGGVKTAASIMAWVNLAELPSKAGRIFYVAGESQSGNDLDLQIERDDVLRFFTAGGGNLQYAPASATLVNKWHMIVATLDTVSKARAIYWDGKPVAKDTGGGQANKTTAFTIGESIVFTGRWLHGGMAEAALWNRALKPAEVASIYAAASGGSSGGAGAGSATAETGSGNPTTGPFATTAKVEAQDAKGPIQLKREEQIALMFMSAMEQIEGDCQLKLQRACTMSEAMTGAGGEHLKFDPNKSDPNYSYTLVSGGMAWEAHANAKKPGLRGFCFMARMIGTTVTTYSGSGKSGWVDTEIRGRSIEGDLFATQ
jgi:hypothetical protein